MKVNESNPHTLSISATHNVVFVLKETEVEDKDLNQNNMGVKESLAVWTSSFMKTMWVVRWAAKGLMPVKPVVHLTGSLTLLPGRACRCSAA